MQLHQICQVNIKMQKLLFSLLFLHLTLFGSVLNEELIYRYLSVENRHIQKIINYNDIAKERLANAQGSFDISSSLKYETKEYPQSSAEYKEFSLSKRFESGVELKGAFREAWGTQEYNNIKTGKDGEYLASLSAPLLPLFTGLNKASHQLQSAKVSYGVQKLSTNDAIRLFTFDVLKAYYEMLLASQKVALLQRLLENAKKRESFISMQIDKGKLAKIEATAALRSTLMYTQELQALKRAFIASQHKLCYFLDLSYEELFDSYEMPQFDATTLKLSSNLQNAIQQAKKNRDDLNAIELQKERILLDQKLNSASRVSKSDLHLYSLYDPIYKEGYKVTFELALSLEQNSYEAKRKENLLQYTQLSLQRELKEQEIENELARLYKQRGSLQQELAQQEQIVTLSNDLLEALKKRFELGSTTLEAIVIEESRFLQTQQKFLELQNELIVNAKAIEMQINNFLK